MIYEQRVSQNRNAHEFLPGNFSSTLWSSLFIHTLHLTDNGTSPSSLRNREHAGTVIVPLSPSFRSPMSWLPRDLHLVGLPIVIFCSNPSVTKMSDFFCGNLLDFPGTKSFQHFPYTENLTRALNTTSLKYCLPSTESIDRWKKIHAYIWRFKVALCKHTSLKSTRVLQKMVGYFSNEPHIKILPRKLEHFSAWSTGFEKKHDCTMHL